MEHCVHNMSRELWRPPWSILWVFMNMFVSFDCQYFVNGLQLVTERSDDGVTVTKHVS